MADVFISYSSKDRALAEALAHGIKAAGWSVWWDPAIRAGENYRDVILRELDAAKAVVVIWTKNSVKSEWVISEAGRAKKAPRDRYIALRQDGLDEHDIPPPFDTRHAIEIEDGQGLIRAIEKIAGLAVSALQPLVARLVEEAAARGVGGALRSQMEGALASAQQVHKHLPLDKIAIENRDAVSKAREAEVFAITSAFIGCAQRRKAEAASVLCSPVELAITAYRFYGSAPSGEYCGGVDDVRLPKGLGQWTWSGKDRYGNHGKTEYSGTWARGMLNGEGISSEFIWDQNISAQYHIVCAGNWSNHRLNGSGAARSYTDSGPFELIELGTWQNGEFQGYGVCTRVDDDWYVTRTEGLILGSPRYPRPEAEVSCGVVWDNVSGLGRSDERARARKAAKWGHNDSLASALGFWRR